MVARAAPGVSSGRIDVLVRPTLPGQVSLSGPAIDGDSLEAHLRRVLYSEVPKSPDTQDGHPVARAGVAVAEGVESREPGAQQRRCLLCGESVGDGGQGALGHHDVLGVAAVPPDPWDGGVLAAHEVTQPARVAPPAVAAEPAHADPLADPPGANVVAKGIDHSGAISWPGINGQVIPGNPPSLAKKSLWQTPHASIRTRTSPRPGSGISRLVSSQSAPASGTCITHIVVMRMQPKPSGGTNGALSRDAALICWFPISEGPAAYPVRSLSDTTAPMGRSGETVCSHLDLWEVVWMMTCPVLPLTSMSSPLRMV